MAPFGVVGIAGIEPAAMLYVRYPISPYSLAHAGERTPVITSNSVSNRRRLVSAKGISLCLHDLI